MPLAAVATEEDDASEEALLPMDVGVVSGDLPRNQKYGGGGGTISGLDATDLNFKPRQQIWCAVSRDGAQKELRRLNGHRDSEE